MSLSVSQVIAHARATTRWAVNMCDNFVANMWGFSASGYNTAVDNWSSTPAQYKHPGDSAAPAGALMYWGGGDGHVAISNGDGTIWTTDLGGMGTVSNQPASLVGSKWGKPYLGWAEPFFQGQLAGMAQGGGTPMGSPVVQGQPVGFFSNPLASLGSDLASSLVKGLFAPIMFLLKDVLYVLEIGAGAALILGGGFIVIKND